MSTRLPQLEIAGMVPPNCIVLINAGSILLRNCELWRAIKPGAKLVARSVSVDRRVPEREEAVQRPGELLPRTFHTR